MSLLHPTLGDLIDRFSILTLKQRHSDAEHFRTEAIEIGKEVTARLARLSQLTRKEIGSLGAEVLNINTLLWDKTEEHYREDWIGLTSSAHTDEVRGYRACELLVELRDCNKERIRLKEEIDRLSGEFRGKEKVDAQ